MPQVREPEHKGLNVNHPTIKLYIENMVRQGRTREDMVQITGMPKEVVERHEHEAREKMRRK